MIRRPPSSTPSATLFSTPTLYRSRQVHRGTGERLDYGALLLATGAAPRMLPLPGFDRPNVFALRSLAAARAIIAACANARSVAFVGAGFIGLEAAGALHARGLEVPVAAPAQVPLARATGPRNGGFLPGLPRRCDARRIRDERVLPVRSRG